MALETVINRKEYAGNGIVTAFSFPYYFLDDGDLVVIITNDTTAVETLQVITTDYTVSGAGVDAGGTVTMVTAPASGETLIIFRDPAITQGLDLRENDALPAENVEEAFDRAAMVSQRLEEQLAGKVGLSEGFVGTFSTELPSDIATADYYLKVNSAGTAFEVAANIESGVSIPSGSGVVC